jgi:FKBP-type peptidyl-prolyl cis-trans isomerase 2
VVKTVKCELFNQRYGKTEKKSLVTQKGDFIYVDYTAKIIETNEVFDTTLEEKAKEGGIFKQDAIYEPLFVVVGFGWVLKKLDNSLIDLEIGQETLIEIPPDDGFGLRDPAKVKVIPISRFRKQDINPYPGAQIEIDGKTAIVRSMGAGRVQVDFNPPLAGKTLEYELTVKSIIEEKIDKIKALIHRRISAVDVKQFNLNVTDEQISIEVPEEAFYLQGLQFAKRGIASDLSNFFSPSKITFIEIFAKSSPPPVEEESEQADDSTDT